MIIWLKRYIFINLQKQNDNRKLRENWEEKREKDHYNSRYISHVNKTCKFDQFRICICLWERRLNSS